MGGCCKVLGDECSIRNLGTRFHDSRAFTDSPVSAITLPRKKVTHNWVETEERFHAARRKLSDQQKVQVSCIFFAPKSSLVSNPAKRLKNQNFINDRVDKVVDKMWRNLNSLTFKGMVPYCRL